MTRISFLALALVAALASPARAQITGPLLAGIEDLYVQIVVDDVLLEAGVSAAQIETKVEAALKAAGVNMVEGGFPTMIVRARGLKIRAGGADLGYSINMSLRVEDMFIPMRPAIGRNEISAVSYINASLVTSSMTGASEMVDTAMDPILSTFLGHYRLAN